MNHATVWDHLQCNAEDVEVLAQKFALAPIAARLLVLRGLNTVDSAAEFLSPSLDQLHDPFRLTDLGIAVDRLLVAINNGERIAVHGDYDVDGITSTVIVRRILVLLAPCTTLCTLRAFCSVGRTLSGLTISSCSSVTR